MMNNVETMKKELAAFRDVHQSVERIGAEAPKAQKDILICRQIQKMLGAREISLFSINPKTERYEFQSGVGQETRRYEGGFIETDHAIKISAIKKMQPGKTKSVRVRTATGVYDFQDKLIVAIPITVADKTYSIFICEFDQPKLSVNGYTPEMIQLLLCYLGPLQAYYLETQALEDRTQSLELLYEIGSHLSSIRDENKLLEKILELIEKYLRVDRCSLMIMDQDRTHLSIKKAFGISGVDLDKVKVPVGVGIAGYVAMGKRPMLIKDIAAEDHLISQVPRRQDFRTNSLLSVPLVAQGEVIGVINVNNRKDGRPFTVDDMDLLMKISTEIAAVLQRSYMALQLKKAREIDQSIKRSMI